MNEILRKLSMPQIRAYLYLINQAPRIVTAGEVALASMATEISIDPNREKFQGYMIIQRIRKKLKDKHFIKTIHTRGYVYIGEQKPSTF